MRNLLLISLLLATAACGEPNVEGSAGLADALTGDAGAETSGGECLTDYDCDDLKGKTPCTLPVCTKGVCSWGLRAEGAPCSDLELKETACERSLCDKEGVCALTAEPVGTPCDLGRSIGECEVAACDVGHACNVTAKPNATACGLGECGNWCQSGKCVVTPDSAYDDNNPCTIDRCDQNTAIVHEPVTGALACDDGDPCTKDGTCSKGVCKKSPGAVCNDGIPCTKDACEKTGCVHTPDDDACAGTDPCFSLACDLSAGCTADTVNSGAKCDDGDSCTAVDTCSDSGTCDGSDNTCTCKSDGDCDNTNKCLPRHCFLGKCEIDESKRVVCDASGDGYCGKNTCAPKTGLCSMTVANAGKACEDNDICTASSACKDGVCAGAGVQSCDDNNPCTTDKCDPVTGCGTTATPGACDDGEKCTTGDSCKKGVCSGKLTSCDDNLGCTFDACDKSSGTCTNDPKNQTCDDNNPCTTDVCDGKSGCKNTPDDKATCKDGNKCTVTKCSAGKCIVSSFDESVPGCGCSKDSDCGDNNPCTQDSCNKGDCVFAPTPLNGKACADANLCVAGSTCAKGICGGGKPKVCNDDNPCTSDSCSPKTGKCATTAKSDGTSCDADGNKCTAGDACKSGACKAGALLDCSDKGGPCAEAACDKATGACAVSNSPKGAACDDGKYCTLKETCDGKGGCGGGAARPCDPTKLACKQSVCDNAKKGCVVVSVKAGTVCDDGKFCTVGESCSAVGSCGGSKARVCAGDSANCQTGLCDEDDGKCKTKVAKFGTLCDDGNDCTKTDKCTFGGKCKGSNLLSGVSCSDGNSCTKPDLCQKGVCTGKLLACDDNKPCTTDSCSAKTGACTHTPAKNGAVCAVNAICQTGKCSPFKAGWAKDIESGGSSRHICALRHDGTMACWGRNSDSQAGDGGSKVNKPQVIKDLGSVKQMAVGFDHSCGLRTDGKLYCWGANNYAQHGTGSSSGDEEEATFAKAVPLLSGVWAGYRRTCGQDLSKKMWCWGFGPSGERGDGSTSLHGKKPGLVKGLPADALTQVDVRSRRSCVVTVKGQLWCWGQNNNKDVSSKSTTTISVATLRKAPTAVKFVGGGRYTLCAVAGLGNQGLCWGSNNDGQAGVGVNTSPIVTPKLLAGVSVKPLAFSGGRRHLIILGNDGKVYAAGSGKNGELGNGATGEVNKLVASTAFTQTYVKAIGFDQSTCVLGTDGEIYCVGSNGYGQLGHGKNMWGDVKVPVKVIKP
ncbi:MAG: hypothetical protein KC502_02585 [Myxococcales bacterium]|nr:hypothetical protein [Myxococcales bacterium]